MLTRLFASPEAMKYMMSWDTMKIGDKVRLKCDYIPVGETVPVKKGTVLTILGRITPPHNSYYWWLVACDGVNFDGVIYKLRGSVKKEVFIPNAFALSDFFITPAT